MNFSWTVSRLLEHIYSEKSRFVTLSINSRQSLSFFVLLKQKELSRNKSENKAVLTTFDNSALFSKLLFVNPFVSRLLWLQAFFITKRLLKLHQNHKPQQVIIYFIFPRARASKGTANGLGGRESREMKEKFHQHVIDVKLEIQSRRFLYYECVQAFGSVTSHLISWISDSDQMWKVFKLSSSKNLNRQIVISFSLVVNNFRFVPVMFFFSFMWLNDEHQFLPSTSITWSPSFFPSLKHIST